MKAPATRLGQFGLLILGGVAGSLLSIWVTKHFY